VNTLYWRTLVSSCVVPGVDARRCELMDADGRACRPDSAAATADCLTASRTLCITSAGSCVSADITPWPFTSQLTQQREGYIGHLPMSPAWWGAPWSGPQVTAHSLRAVKLARYIYIFPSCPVVVNILLFIINYCSQFNNFVSFLSEACISTCCLH